MKQYQEEQDDPKNCYLISSNIYDNEALEEDDLNLWNAYLEDDNMDVYFKTAITELYLYYKISPMKVNLNLGYIQESDFYTDLFLDIAPSLKRLKPMFSNIPLGYPRWFLISFPDVLFWAMNENNQMFIINNLKDDNDGKFLSINSLKFIIELYLERTKKQLECKLYKPK